MVSVPLDGASESSELVPLKTTVPLPPSVWLAPLSKYRTP